MNYCETSAPYYFYYEAQRLSQYHYLQMNFPSFVSPDLSPVSSIDSCVSLASQPIFEQSETEVKPLSNSRVLEKAFCTSKDVEKAEVILSIRRNQPRFQISVGLLREFNKLRLEKREVIQLDQIWHDLRFFVVPKIIIKKDGQKYVRILSSVRKLPIDKLISFYTCESYDCEFLNMNTRSFNGEGSATKIQKIINEAIKDSFANVTPLLSSSSFQPARPESYPKNETLKRLPETDKKSEMLVSKTVPAIISNSKRQKVSSFNVLPVSSSDSSSLSSEEDDFLLNFKNEESRLSISREPWEVKDSELGI